MKSPRHCTKMSDLLWFSNYLADGTHHFWLSGLTGLLGSSLTLITLSVSGLIWERGTRRKISTAADYGILLTALLAGLACAFLAHVWLDGYSAWHSAPLGPPLQIDTGGANL